eukprot:1459078-Lingulodinium_polyedra.AAC.1
MREGRAGHGVPHHANCRARIEKAMRDDGSCRLAAAEERLNTEAVRLAGHAVHADVEEEGKRPEDAVPVAEEGGGGHRQDGTVPSGHDGPAQHGAGEGDSELRAEDEDTEMTGEVRVEHGCESDCVDERFEHLPKGLGREATNLYELFLVSGADPGVAKQKLVE